MALTPPTLLSSRRVVRPVAVLRLLWKEKKVRSAVMTDNSGNFLSPGKRRRREQQVTPPPQPGRQVKDWPVHSSRDPSNNLRKYLLGLSEFLSIAQSRDF